MQTEMTDFAPVSVRLPIRSTLMLDEVSERHGVSRHRLMSAILQLAARDPAGLVDQALNEVTTKRELAGIVERVGRKA
jgi:hypothetical protein